MYRSNTNYRNEMNSFGGIFASCRMQWHHVEPSKRRATREFFVSEISEFVDAIECDFALIEWNSDIHSGVDDNSIRCFMKWTDLFHKRLSRIPPSLPANPLENHKTLFYQFGGFRLSIANRTNTTPDLPYSLANTRDYKTTSIRYWTEGFAFQHYLF